MAHAPFKVILRGSGEESLQIEVRCFERGNRLDVRQYIGALPTANGFNAPIELISKTIDELEKAKAKAISMGILKDP